MGLINTLTHPIVSWLTRESNTRPRPLSDFERIQHELKPCDVILVEGRSRISDVIRMTTQNVRHMQRFMSDVYMTLKTRT